MSVFFSDEFSAIIRGIPDQTYNPAEILESFGKSIAEIAEAHKMIYYKSFIAEPYNVRANKPGNRQIIEMFDHRGGRETEDYVIKFEIGSGGFVEITSGIEKGQVWTEEAKNDCYILAKIIYLLFGRARAMSALSRLSFTDGLTGIANVPRLNQVIAKTYARAEQAEYCSNFINIKNMKLLNNRYTQAVGDRLLVVYANMLSDFVGKDGIVARMGGDNFVACIKKNRETELLDYLEKIEVEIMLQDGSPLCVSMEARVGYYYVEQDSKPSDVIRNCDIALRYARDDNEPDMVIFRESMKTVIFRNKQLEENVPFAIKNKEFHVFYQPKADISDPDNYRVVGAEALVRWFKDDEVISPAEFIPILERNGMVTLVDFYVFESICKTIKEWESQGITPVRISSNFSRRHLFDEHFADKIEEVIKKYDVDPKYIEIEITESYDNEDMNALKAFEKRMHQLGIKLSVDDFGSGFSSLKMLKNIVSDTIKLDKSIIDDIGGEDSGSDIIVRSIIQMVTALGKHVIAEGVEHKHQADFLRENGCKTIQGYMFSRPVPLMDFVELLKKYSENV